MTPPQTASPTTHDRVVVESFLGDGEHRTLADDVLDGLTRPFKELPPKHFYDAHGAELFDQICELPEYYPTRCERAILEQRSAEIVARTGAAELVELGSGTAAKTRLLLARDARGRDAGPLRADRRHRVDGARRAPRGWSRSSTGCACTGSSATSSATSAASRRRSTAARGSSRSWAGRSATSRRARGGASCAGSRQLLGPDDFLLLGTDLVKDPAVLEAAYDDSAGVTAAFNRNVLTVLNRELDADFAVDAYEHVAFFDRDREWIEMRLRAQRPQRVTVGKLGLRLTFAAGEELRTEISAKFTPERISGDLAAAGHGAGRDLDRSGRPVRVERSRASGRLRS